MVWITPKALQIRLQYRSAQSIITSKLWYGSHLKHYKLGYSTDQRKALLQVSCGVDHTQSIIKLDYSIDQPKALLQVSPGTDHT